MEEILTAALFGVVGFGAKFWSKMSKRIKALEAENASLLRQLEHAQKPTINVSQSQSQEQDKSENYTQNLSGNAQGNQGQSGGTASN